MHAEYSRRGFRSCVLLLSCSPRLVRRESRSHTRYAWRPWSSESTFGARRQESIHNNGHLRYPLAVLSGTLMVFGPLVRNVVLSRVHGGSPLARPPPIHALRAIASLISKAPTTSGCWKLFGRLTLSRFSAFTDRARRSFGRTHATRCVRGHLRALSTLKVEENPSTTVAVLGTPLAD